MVYILLDFMFLRAHFIYFIAFLRLFWFFEFFYS
ncbi:hypothetical protein Vca1114GL_00956 [Vibrio campbellii]|nr:hypothetical protein Vca1114GL_00956 [Vibrio campbellii]